VVPGKQPLAHGRVPLSDAAGDVITLGWGVDELKVGDAVVSVFYPYWLGGDITATTRRETPRESLESFAREYVRMPAHFFTKMALGFSHAKAAILTYFGVTA
jgi:NADPH:quinone reductase-like Zn-dependent oxidoreductase